MEAPATGEAGPNIWGVTIGPQADPWAQLGSRPTRGTGLGSCPYNPNTCTESGVSFMSLLCRLVLGPSLCCALLAAVQAVKEGKIAFELAHGMDVYQVRPDRPQMHGSPMHSAFTIMCVTAACLCVQPSE